VLTRIAHRHGVGPDAVAVAAVLARPWADVVLVGPVSPAQLAANLAASRLRLAAGELCALTALTALTDSRYWARRSSLHWQ
jgi:aryl-alcohol dehydrogenase-like predicted oxidoreductase